MSFEEELEQVINRHSQENGSDTPDFILAHYLVQCLDAFNCAVQAREQWYDRGAKLAQVEAERDQALAALRRVAEALKAHIKRKLALVEAMQALGEE